MSEIVFTLRFILSSVINESNFTIFTINRDWYLFRISIISLCSLAHFFLYGFFFGVDDMLCASSFTSNWKNETHFFFSTFHLLKVNEVDLLFILGFPHSRLVIVCAIIIVYAHDWMLNVNKRKSLLLIMVKQRDPLTSNHCSLTTAFRRRSLT